MPDIPLQFRWLVAEDGYRWLEAQPLHARDQMREPFLTLTAARSAQAASA